MNRDKLPYMDKSKQKAADEVCRRAAQLPQISEDIPPENRLLHYGSKKNQYQNGTAGRGADPRQDRLVIDRLRRTQPDTLTPIEAMGLLYELKQKLQ